jgi:hypothetical protein
MIALLVPVKCAALLHHRPHVRWVQQAASSTFQIPLPASMYVFLRMFVACLTRCTTGCPGGYSGNRCEIKPAGTGGGGKQSCSPATERIQVQSEQRWPHLLLRYDTFNVYCTAGTKQLRVAALHTCTRFVLCVYVLSIGDARLCIAC